ncbi:MAG: hypothetical protein H5T33_00075 [Candidatus Methanosuratus sp.]|nr:hypothetical protein [Candidatus Methanosuratincola sp.]
MVIDSSALVKYLFRDEGWEGVRVSLSDGPHPCVRRTSIIDTVDIRGLPHRLIID